jgi:hypothetical protein
LSVGGGTIWCVALVPTECWFRTFNIAGGGYSATCFVIPRHDRQWLITAKHFIDDVAKNSNGSLHLFTHDGKEDRQFGS